MKAFILSIFCLLMASWISAQSLSNQVVANGGGHMEVSQAGSISYTLGELFFETYQGDINLTQGFQQAYNVIVNSIYQVNDPRLAAKIFPNPAIDRFFIEFSDPLLEAEGTLFDILGKPLQRIKIQGKQEINLGNYPAGIYLLQVYSSSLKGMHSFKIQKQ